MTENQKARLELSFARALQKGDPGVLAAAWRYAEPDPEALRAVLAVLEAREKPPATLPEVRLWQSQKHRTAGVPADVAARLGWRWCDLILEGDADAARTVAALALYDAGLMARLRAAQRERRAEVFAALRRHRKAVRP
jgi:hypothetical protein